MSRTNKPPKESPSKQLRNVFYNLWNQDPEEFEDFDLYYDSKVNKLIGHYKKFIKLKG